METTRGIIRIMKTTMTMRTSTSITNSSGSTVTRPSGIALARRMSSSTSPSSRLTRSA
jgi:hypothetical protein